jgi:TRAP-type C4-dicarboxylate transport system permease small subunit
MLVPFDRSNKNQSNKNQKSIREKWGFGFILLSMVIAAVLIALAFIQPTASNWIAESVQAEFTGDVAIPVEAPTQMAQPGMQMRTVRVDR